MALFIISNRLPVKVTSTDDGIIFTRSEGGLTTGLASLDQYPEKYWVGWPGIFTNEKDEQAKIRENLAENNFYPVFLTEEQITNYYEGYSNSMIWPLCHYFYTYIQYESKFWETYQEVNRLFCREALKLVKPGDMVWVQDYQLMLLPGMLRSELSDISIGYFHHIPFPSYELFRVLPERAEILKGLLGADLIGFHTHDYMRHFISAVYRVLGLHYDLDEIHFDKRIIRVEAFPMGINYRMYNDALLDKCVQEKAIQFKKDFGDHFLVLSVDRLDYSKGILHRLKGFNLFLEKHPEYQGKISLVMVVVPSRDNVGMYAELKTKIDEMIGYINGNYSLPDWSPVYYFYRSFPFDELTALYHIANTALVTPLRDGMNLVAKEFVAVKRKNPGVLILSEMAGASAELQEALIINPNNIDELEIALDRAFQMSESEQLERMSKMQHVISRQTVDKWAYDFISELKITKEKNNRLYAKYITGQIAGQIKSDYDRAKRRLIILDYDGTLVPLVKNPEMAIPGKELLQTLSLLVTDKRNKIAINSGRDTKFLDQCFGHLNVSMAAEHGLFYKEAGSWKENIKVEFPEDEELFSIINRIVEKTPGSKVEKKKKSIVWHYRNSDAWLAELREKQLINAIMNPCARLNLQIVRGNKVVEIKTSGVTKGTETLRLLETDNYDFILAMGDDITDEDIFQSLPEDAITVKVGSVSDYARYSQEQEKTLGFLNKLADNYIT